MRMIRVIPAFMAIAFIIGALGGCSETVDPGLNAGNECRLCHGVPPLEKPDHDFTEKIINPGLYNIDCNTCHLGYNRQYDLLNDKLHNNKTIDVVYDSLFFEERFEVLPDAEYRGQTCSNIPCHGYGLEAREPTTWAKDSSTFKTWNDDESYTEWRVEYHVSEKLDCMGCHNTTEHKNNKNCNSCHELVTRDGINITNYSLHINGKVDKD